jgi:tripartite-type tricarboxylate transporter receptor subunit TctC
MVTQYPCNDRPMNGETPMYRCHAFLRRVAGRRGSFAALAAAAALVGSLGAFATAASAQGWPQRPVKFILPFGAGSATDAAARMMSDKLAARWGKPIVIENKPGADGLLAIGAFVSANDDHVLLYASSASFNAHPYMREKLPYDLERDLAPIARVTDSILTASVPAATPPTTVAEFVALARAQPNKLNAAGAAGVPEFTLGYFLHAHNLAVTRCRIATSCRASPISAPGRSSSCSRRRRRCGRWRRPARSGADIPTIYEAGFPALAVETTAGLYGPASMPRELRERLSKDVIAVVSDPVISERLVATGQSINLGGPDDLTKTLKQQAEQMATVAKALGLKAGKWRRRLPGKNWTHCHAAQTRHHAEPRALRGRGPLGRRARAGPP